MRFVFFFFQFYIGGVPNKQDGLLVMQNFTGCMENLYLNTTNVIYRIKEAINYGDIYLYEKVNTLYSCPVSNSPYLWLDMKHVKRNTYRPYLYKRQLTCEMHLNNQIFKTR